VFEQGTVPDFTRYAGWDAVTDIPAALFFPEIMAAFPGCKFILTVRDEMEWLESIRRFYGNPSRFEKLTQFTREQKDWLAKISEELRKYAYGSEKVLPSLYLKRFREHTEHVRRTIPADRLLVMDITKGDGWSKLCPFLDRPVPPVPFPCRNVAEKT
jgi:hypothetical protein